ncbi:MAG: ribose-5-phosphate isomerase RpiA [Actinomycetota bacterium]|nr:ribose-5-phosphate isomerase RpiA [Actinomycetota bacterium]
MTDSDDQGYIDSEKRLAAEAAAELVEAGMTVGLGTGSTVAYLLGALARRKLDITCVATSPATFDTARSLGLDVREFTGIDHLDVTIDGADQVDPAGWLVKGGGGAHTREKIVAAAAERYVVIVSSNKLVDALAAPVPLELLAFGHDATLRALGDARVSDKPSSPDNGVLADYFGPIGDPGELASRLSAIPGVVEHGLFAPAMVSDILVGQGSRVHRRCPGD